MKKIMKTAATYTGIAAIALMMGTAVIGCTVQGPAGPPGMSGAPGATGAQGSQGDPAPANPTVTKSYNSTTTTSNDSYAFFFNDRATTEKTSTQNY